MIDSRKWAEIAAEAADDKKALGITLIDVEAVSSVTDYFIVCSGHTPIQVQAIADHVEDRLAAAGAPAPHVEGAAVGRWILLDFGVVVVHVMLDKEREFYNLERLWSHGQQSQWPRALQGA